MTIKQKLVNLLDDVFALKGEGEETQTIYLNNAFSVSITRDPETGDFKTPESFSGTSIFGLFDDEEYLQADDFFMKPLEYNVDAVESVSDDSVNVRIYLKIPANVNPISKCILIKNGETSWIAKIRKSNDNTESYYTEEIMSEINYIKTLIGEPQE